MALEIFQVIACTLGVTYNVNVWHTESLMLNMVVSLAGHKSLLDKLIQEFIAVASEGISYIHF